MQVYDAIESFTPPPGGTILSIGNFDGVHLGHRAILRAARTRADRGACPVVALTFEPHPIAILAPGHAPPRLTTLSERLALLGDAGVDAAIVLRSTPALLAEEAEDFLRRIVLQLRPRAIVEGASFNFGRARRGSPATLAEHAGEHGYEVEIVATARSDTLPDGPEVNSSAVRAALRTGDIERAAAMLGRHHRITGKVGSGAGRGAGIGVPTANLTAVPQLVPGAGVYAAVAELASGELRLAAANIGEQPTFGDSTPRIEAHLLDFTGDLRGAAIGLHFIAHLRSQVAFASVAALLAQIQADIAQVRECSAELAALHSKNVLPNPSG